MDYCLHSKVESECLYCCQGQIQRLEAYIARLRALVPAEALSAHDEYWLGGNAPRQMASAVSQPWDAGSEADSLVVTYCADANDTLMPLVRLGDVPTDGTWEVLHATATNAFSWQVVRGKIEGHHRMLVVARPIGSSDAD